MRIDGGIHAFGFVAGVGTPALSVADEEALLGSEAVDRFQFLAAGFTLPGHVSQHQPAQIGDIFAHGQLAVDLDVIHGDILRILVGDATGALVKLFAILRRPPVAQIALGIELAAFVVEAVRQFVANGGAGVAVVRGVVRAGIKRGGCRMPAGKLMSLICGL